MRAVSLVLSSLVWAILWGVGQGNPASGQEVASGLSGAGPVAEEVNEALEDLDEAGVLPSAEERAAFLSDLPESPGPRFGTMVVRFGFQPERGHGGSLAFSLGRGPWQVRARGRFDSAGLTTRSAVARLNHSGVTLQAGFLGFRHGFGMLMAPPGRSASLGADNPMGPGTVRFVGWTGAVDTRTWLGVGLGLARGRWRFHGLEGIDPLESVSERRRVRLVRVALAGERGQVAATGLITPTSRAVSLGGVRTGDTYQGAMEGVMWLNPAGEPSGWAGVAQAAWRPARKHLVEASWAGADRDGTWPIGSRPAALPAWAGHGYALRFRTTPGPGMSLRGMWHQGWSLPGAGPDERSRRRITELQWHQRMAGAWELGLRFRRSSRTEWVWSQRHPWLPAVQTPSELRTVVSLNFNHDRGNWRVGVLARTLFRQVASGSGRRSLLGFQWRSRPDPDWAVRFFATTAWGDDVDLVSAVVPFAGLVLPRHWGKWRSETGLGVERTGNWGSLRVGGGVRRPESGRGEILDPWIRAAVDWRW